MTCFACFIELGDFSFIIIFYEIFLAFHNVTILLENLKRPVELITQIPALKQSCVYIFFYTGSRNSLPRD